MGPLNDLRVLELGVLIAGPFCGQLLADFGAEVIKIEQPGVGDPMRQWGEVLVDGQSLFWAKIGRNKKSVTLNLRVPEGQALFKELVAKSDVVIENFRPGTMEKWGLGWEVLKEINPKLIMTRVSGFGQSGPYAPRAGYGSIGEAMGGLRYTTGDPDRLPSRTGWSIGDSLAATYAALGTMMALHQRDKTGDGQVVDSAIYEAVLALSESLIPEYQIAGHIRERTGAVLPRVAPSNVYPCTDGMVLIAANQDTVFERLCAAMEQPNLKKDPRFCTHLSRGAHQELLDGLIADWTTGFSLDDMEALCETNGVPCSRIYRAPDMLEDPHFAAREAITEVMHPVLGPFKMPSVFPKLSASPGSISHTAPELGEHNDEILGTGLGLTRQALESFIEKGVI
ncbi:MAG: CoA transferase [Alphaproteobacteria bacterium]|nr:MAG: CoA transferase [Alphaproteobacteria bacterium]